MPIYTNAARIVIAIDPATTSHEGSDETGIVACALSVDKCGYVLDDLSGKFSPDGWAQRAIDAYWEMEAGSIVGETNNGGDMIEAVIRSIDKNVRYKGVRASRSKATRAEPVLALYEKGRIFHVRHFQYLEDEMTNWEPGNQSPSRLDAMVWAFTELFFGSRKASVSFVGRDR